MSAAAQWVQQYRGDLTPQRRAHLAASLLSPEGLATMQQSTALYNLQDVHYCDQSQVVVSELLQTIASLKTQP